MTAVPVNVHATAIVVGEAGLLFIGPSGAGKSITAFNCMVTARRSAAFAALIADDQVFLSQKDGALIATCPDAIAGLIEIRGSGIARLPHIPSAPIHLAVLLVERNSMERLPPEGEVFDIPGIGSLPQLRMVQEAQEPLAIITAFYPDIGIPRTF